jgi:GntR family transcriptional regulator
MVIAINEYSDIPIYVQIRNQIVLGISDGRLEPGEQLPTVRALAEEMGINSMTVNKAYQILKSEGYIYTDRRNGAKVRERMEFSKELPQESKEMLERVVSEAKIRGISKEEFYTMCDEFFA